MALTPDDVVQKEFSKPKSFGRNGYDENQVDDFLDEIVVELRRLNAQNDSLSDQLEDCRRGKNATPASSSTTPGKAPAAAKASGASGVPALTPVNRSVQGEGDSAAKDEEIAKLKRELEAARAAKPAKGAKSGGDVAALTAERDQAKRDLEAAKARVAELEKQVSAAPTGDPSAAAVAGSADAASVIALAQRVHDQHIKEGETERDRLVSEAKAHHDKVIGDANAKSEELLTSAKKRHEELLSTGQAKFDELVAGGQKKHDELVADAEKRRDSVLGELAKSRSSLDSEIEKLKKFESDYRSNLKGYFTEQLRQLDQQKVEPAGESETKKA